MSNKKNISIIIDNQKLDFDPDNVNFPLTFSVEDKNGISSVQGSRTERSVTLPATKKNDDALSRWWDIGNTDISAANFRTASVLVNGLPILQGKAQLTEVTTQSNRFDWKGGKYRVALYGDNADWFLSLKDVRIGDLDFSDCQHTFSSAEVQNGFSASYDSGDVYGYTVIKLRDWSNADSVHWSDCTPFIFVRAILDRAFNSIGYTYSSDFFDTENFKRLILPLPFPEKYPEEYSEDFLNVAAETTSTINITPSVGVNVIFDTQTKTPTFANPYNIATGEYTAPGNGFFKINVCVTVDNVPPLTSFFVFIQLDGVTVSNPIQVPLTSPPSSGQTYCGTELIQVVDGQVITIQVFSPGSTFDITLATFEIFGEIELTGSFDFRCEYLLKQYKVNDFLKGLAQMFNLMFETKGLGQNIRIEPKDQYLYKQRTPASLSQLNEGFFINTQNEISNKADLSIEGRVKAISNISERFTFSYQSSDKTVEAIEENQDFKLYQGGYLFDQDRFKKSTTNQENAFFSSTVHLFDREIQGEGSLVTPLVPLIFPVDYAQDSTSTDKDVENVGARILYFAGQRVGIDGTIDFDDGTTISEINLPSAFMVNYNDLTGQDPSLSYSDITINNIEVQGLFRQFFLKEFARKRTGKELEAFLLINEQDILNLTFRNKVFLQGQLYILKKVESWSPIIDRSTKVFLEYDKTDEQVDYNNLEKTPLVGFLGQIIP